MAREKNNRSLLKNYWRAAILITGIAGLILFILVRFQRLSYYAALPKSNLELRVLPLNSFNSPESFPEKEGRFSEYFKKIGSINHQNFVQNSSNNHPSIDFINEYRYCDNESNFTLSVLNQWENEENTAPELAAAKEFLSEFLSTTASDDTADEKTLPWFVSLEDSAIILDQFNFTDTHQSLQTPDCSGNSQYLNSKDNQYLNSKDKLDIKNNPDKRYSFMRNPLNRILFFAADEVRLDYSPSVRLLKNTGTICLTPTFLILLITLGISAPGLHVLCPINDAILSLLIFWEKLSALCFRFLSWIFCPNDPLLHNQKYSAPLTGLLLSELKTIRLLI